MIEDPIAAPERRMAMAEPAQLHRREVLGSLPLMVAAFNQSQAEESYTLHRGPISFESHEALEGFFNLGENLTIHVPPDSINATRLRDLQGITVDLILKPVKERKLEGLGR